MSNTFSTQVCLVLICCIRGFLCNFSPRHDICSWPCAVMKPVPQLERSFLAILTAFVHLLGLLHRQILEGLRTAARRGKNSSQSCIYPRWELLGSLTAGNKDTVYAWVSKEMPSQTVVPGQEQAAVSHTTPNSALCCAAAIMMASMSSTSRPSLPGNKSTSIHRVQKQTNRFFSL